jgi:hypothetical protein
VLARGFEQLVFVNRRARSRGRRCFRSREPDSPRVALCKPRDWHGSFGGAKVVPLLLLEAAGLPPDIGSLHGASIVGHEGEALSQRIAALLAASERSAIVLPLPPMEKLSSKDGRTARAFVAALPAALAAPPTGAPYLLPALREHGPPHVERVLRICN